jgi:hypothetical protein
MARMNRMGDKRQTLVPHPIHPRHPRYSFLNEIIYWID